MPNSNGYIHQNFNSSILTGVCTVITVNSCQRISAEKKN